MLCWQQLVLCATLFVHCAAIASELDIQATELGPQHSRHFANVPIGARTLANPESRPRRRSSVHTSASGSVLAERRSKALLRTENWSPPCTPVEPELQLRTRHKIGLFSKKEDADTLMLKEGIDQHPMLTLESDLMKADFVLWSVRGSGEEEEGKPPQGVLWSRLVQIDWSDGAMVLPYISQSSVVAIFKRSFVRKLDGVFVAVADGCGDEKCFPFGYAVLDQYLEGINASSVGDPAKRPRKLMCSLRPWLPPTPEQLIRQVGIARNRVLWWLNRDNDLPSDSLISGKNGTTSVTEGSFNSGIASMLQEAGYAELSPDAQFDSHDTVHPKYKQVLSSTRIAVTANPAKYEGDHRLWEHFAAGNLVLSDKLRTPLPFAPVPGEHYEDFDVADVSGNEEAFRSKLHSLLEGSRVPDAMACRGFQHAMRHHRSVSRLDYIVRSLLELTLGAQYMQTGRQLRKQDPTATPGEAVYVHNLQLAIQLNTSMPEYMTRIKP